MFLLCFPYGSWRVFSLHLSDTFCQCVSELYVYEQKAKGKQTNRVYMRGLLTAAENIVGNGKMILTSFFNCILILTSINNSFLNVTIMKTYDFNAEQNW